MFKEIPLTRPQTPLLDSINQPADLRKLKAKELDKVCEELRHYLLYSVGKSGGHFGAGLGVVELTVALHYVFDTPNDNLVWDVGHQAYPHKILTGRREALPTIRKRGGLSGFPKRSESEYDTFGVGHSSTSISAGLGMDLAAKQQDRANKTVAIIGDGAMTAGMAFEALNHASHTLSNMIVILNDNEMSISKNVGGLSNYFARIWASKLYINFREGSKKILSMMPQAKELASRTEEHMKGMVAPGTLFEELGFNYLGPFDGHDMEQLLSVLSNIKELDGPHLIHLSTVKGKGFEPAEQDPIRYHALNKIDPKPKVSIANEPEEGASKKIKYQDVFGQWLCDTAEQDKKLIGITPAMCEGSGMVEFSKRFEDRYHDVAIAEQHALTFAAGLACEGMKPVVAIYSTFLQRAYDQLVHDIALQDLDVTFGIDRAGLVGEDGATHSGSFDLSFMRCIPKLVIAAPSDENECRTLLHTCYMHEGPSAVRYPRGTGPGAEINQQLDTVEIGRGRLVREGSEVAILCFGSPLQDSLKAAEEIGATVYDMRFVKPIDTDIIKEAASQYDLIVTVEDNTIKGGAGSAVNEYLVEEGILVPLLNLGLPDEFVEHGSVKELKQIYTLDADGIAQAIAHRVAKIRARKTSSDSIKAVPAISE